MHDVFRDNSTRLSPGIVPAPALFFFFTSVKTIIFLGTKWMDRTLGQVFASGEAMPLLPWQRSLRGQSDIANCPLSLIQMGRECQTSPWRRPPFRLAGRPLQRTAWNVLLIKAERFNGRISLSTAWNISHSPTILWGYSIFVERLYSQRSFEINQRGENGVVKQVLGVLESP